jgi:hypothetical protein
MTKKDRQNPRKGSPERGISGDDLLFFIETAEFTASWDEMGLDAENDLATLQLRIMSNPKGAPVVSGTGGLRKLRFAPPRWQVGKSGAVRVCYTFFEEYGIVLLLLSYPKSEKDDLTITERNAVRAYIKRAKDALDRLKRLD